MLTGLDRLAEAGDAQTAGGAARAGGVERPQHAHRAAHVPVVVVHAAAETHAAVAGRPHHEHLIGGTRRVQGLELTQLPPHACDRREVIDER